MSGRPSRKSAEIGLFRPFPEGLKSTWKSRKQRKKAFFLRYHRISFNPHILNPHLRHPNSGNGQCHVISGIYCCAGTAFAATLLTSTFFLGSGGSPLGGSSSSGLWWRLAWKGFSVTGRDRKVPGKEQKGCEGHPPVLKIKVVMSKVVFSSGVNKSAREQIGRQNLSQKVPSKKWSLAVIFSPRNCRENAHSTSANFEEDTLGATCSAGPFCLLPISGLLIVFSGALLVFSETS